MPNLISKANTASAVWADTAYRSKANEQHLADSGLRSQIHRKKRAGRPMAKNVARANNARSTVRAAVEHVFARQKGPMALVVRTIGLARATVKIGARQHRVQHAPCSLAHHPAPSRSLKRPANHRKGPPVAIYPPYTPGLQAPDTSQSPATRVLGGLPTSVGDSTPRGLTPYEAICATWTKQPERFTLNPLHQMPGLNI